MLMIMEKASAIASFILGAHPELEVDKHFDKGKGTDCYIVVKASKGHVVEDSDPFKLGVKVHGLLEELK